MIQWVTDYARYRGEDKPSKFDQLFTKIINLEKDGNYECPFGKSDHVVLKIEIKRGMEGKLEESHKKKRINYAKANYIALKKFFNETDWTKIKEIKDMPEKKNLSTL